MQVTGHELLLSREVPQNKNPAENIKKALGWFGLLVVEKPCKIICESLNDMRKWWAINSFQNIFERVYGFKIIRFSNLESISDHAFYCEIQNAASWVIMMRAWVLILLFLSG